MAKILNEKILDMQELAQGIYKMEVMSEYISSNALPGQFVNIKCCNGINAYLRRPVSICRANRNKGTFDIVFQVRGRGTSILAEKTCSNTIDLIGPLGKPFDTSDEYRNIAIVGGGIGIFPLLFLLDEMKNCKKTAFLGFRDYKSVVLESEFKSAADKLYVATDDGSYGCKGFVTEIFNEAANNEKYDIVYTCGPEQMMKKVAATAEKLGMKCQVSIEQRMGCGIGACLVCVCKTKRGSDWDYSHVCKDGPVFWSTEIEW